ncbi:Zn-dependent hydrolase [Alkalicoccus chagannorensis]|uniref:Zn-dependent hydrolase n=1 Tax=Alkalicoccus chagannorensis TaxID=427072 RepID=UPI000413C170|nr:Zn-dependent hydrolase [Alkalicoccus chagannorensis]
MLKTKENIHEKLNWLATFSDPGEGITRLLFTKTWQQAREALQAYMEELGFDVRGDAAGNLYGRIPGRSPRVVMTGSHLDSVRSGGRYDGAYGVLAAIHAVYHTWCLHGTPEKTMEVVVFSEEEGSRFPYAYLGSRYVTGQVDPERLENAADGAGVTIDAARIEAGITEAWDDTPRTDIDQFLEIHIEQGRQLEAAGESIGIVDAIVGQQRFYFTVSGQANHAGTTPMPLRADAMEAAAAMIHRLLEETRRRGDPLVATVGQLDASPGSVNVIPGSVTFSLDVRHPDDEALQAAVAAVSGICRDTAEAYGVSLHIDPFMTIDAVPMSQAMCHDLDHICSRDDIAYRRMYSGAGHDAQVMGRHCPSALLFVPSTDGISHNPKEYTEPQYLDEGITVMQEALTIWAYKEESS